jgi:Rps23 Pro-64 3,4-dihydroxylase Tpa1-like proline 4-hydroxylase
VVIRGAVSEDDCDALTEALDEEPSERLAAEIYEVNATEETFTHPTLVALVEELGGDAMLHALSSISSKKLSRVKARGYAFGPGHYLLPHADRDVDTLRQVAFALYVAVSDDLDGGELELFECETEFGQITATEPAGRIPPRVGTLILFDVHDTSLHQVREVTRGIRGSISGWFY